ncbi:phytoene dehydrogenase-like protein [Breznakia blatticola]|uniref:Phytoene dehydrogenase-like protein n=1 Tax=Breznakia blatticola TaxID=1754012 RepID=A0A4R8A5S1_9FIRM|nr:NAD(P)/FAD-dependent oxidoreductase [Breznakia blatticola]TDW26017.1 phytoene dehydrogenase-like protein [Breznakia blatticola]
MKVIIIGAGIAGLSAGIFARQSGFDVTIFETHTMPGGNATGWKRKGYYFEGGMHWLVGSSEKTELNKLWYSLGALQENNPIFNRDPFLTYVNGEEKIALYRDTDKLKKHLLEISPQDEKAICQLIKDIRALKKATMPITDIKGVRVHHKTSIPLSQLFAYVKAAKTMAKLSKMSIDEYVGCFKHKGIHELLKSVIAMGEYSATSLIFTLGGLAEYDSGYPKGGSLQMVQNMANTFENIGGVIEYGKKVSCINVVDAQVNSISIGNKLYMADAVIVTSDTLVATEQLFDPPLCEDWITKLKDEIIPVNCTFISLGVKQDMSHLPTNIVLSLKEPFVYCGRTYTSISLNNYATFEGYAPKGCTAITIMLYEDTYDRWKQLYLEGTYQDKKEELAKNIIQLLEENLSEIKGKVEVWDIATPLTYERYCGTFRGSWMSVMKPKSNSNTSPSKSKDIKNLYFAGQRLMIPGGMPAAMVTSRTAVQHLCKDTNTVFQGGWDKEKRV